MIISASRRTDIPAFYADWFMRRVREGYCVTRNPFNPRQARRLSLKPEDVDAIVFWSKNPAPLMEHLPELDDKGYRYYFQFTLNDYPRELEQSVPPVEERLATFTKLAERVGQERVVWRYDPIIISNRNDHDYHRRKFAELCGRLEGRAVRVMTSVVTWYRKTGKNLAPLSAEGYRFDENALDDPATADLLSSMSEISLKHGMEIFTCSTEKDFHGVKHGSCIDAELINRLWNLGYPAKKDPGQRKACLCAVSRDVGANDTCVHACPYCYATQNIPLARKRFQNHNPASEELLPPARQTNRKP